MALNINSDRAEHTNNTNQKPTANRQVKAFREAMASAAKKLGQALHQVLAREIALQTPECLRIPADVAQSLLSLDVSNELLKSLPDHLPPNLLFLDVSRNQLQKLPEHLPQNLENLNASRNQLQKLPDHLPQNLENLDVSKNQLQTLPNTLPKNLLSLNARKNLLREVDVGIFQQLAHNAVVDLRHNPLSPKSLTRLFTRPAAYQSAQIHFPRIEHTYLELWKQWASEPHDASEHRDRAIGELCAWLQNGQSKVQQDKCFQLFLMDHGLKSLPRLPDMHELDISGNNFPELPDNLPPSLSILWANNIELTRLPENLPRQIRQLEVKNNLLTHLPEKLPYNLNSLKASNNQLTKLPENLPQSVTSLDLKNNHIVDLPESAIRFIMGMDQHACVVLSDNPLSQQTINRLNALRNNPDYAGARVYYTIYHNGRPQEVKLLPFPVADAAPQAAPAQLDVADAQTALAQATDQSAELGQAAAAWATPPTRTNIAATTRLWQGFANEPGADEFKQFLNRLRQTVNMNDPAFQRSVAQWLIQLENNPVLRADTFAVGIGATESCEDRISLTYNTMRKVSMAADVSRGTYDQRLPDLITLARGMFRLEQLENIAHETTATLAQTHGADEVDEIGVYLGYQVMLREPLALPVDTANMAFFRTSGLTQNHLDEAQAQVQQAERQEFVTYLSTNFMPWQSVLQRLAPEQHAQAQEELIKAVGNEFTRRLNARLQTIVLHNDPDAERSLGAQVRADIAREVYGQLTRDFLASKGMLNLLR